MPQNHIPHEACIAALYYAPVISPHIQETGDFLGADPLYLNKAGELGTPDQKYRWRSVPRPSVDVSTVKLSRAVLEAPLPLEPPPLPSAKLDRNEYPAEFVVDYEYMAAVETAPEPEYEAVDIQLLKNSTVEADTLSKEDETKAETFDEQLPSVPIEDKVVIVIQHVPIASPTNINMRFIR